MDWRKAVIARSPDHGAEDPDRAHEEEHHVDSHLTRLQQAEPTQPASREAQAAPFTPTPSTTPWSTPFQSTTRESQTSGRTINVS